MTVVEFFVWSWESAPATTTFWAVVALVWLYLTLKDHRTRKDP